MRLLCPTPSDAFGTARQSGIDNRYYSGPTSTAAAFRDGWLLRRDTFNDGSGGIGGCSCSRAALKITWADALLGQHVRVKMAPASTCQLLPWR